MICYVHAHYRPKNFREFMGDRFASPVHLLVSRKALFPIELPQTCRTPNRWSRLIFDEAAHPTYTLGVRVTRWTQSNRAWAARPFV